LEAKKGAFCYGFAFYFWGVNQSLFKKKSECFASYQVFATFEQIIRLFKKGKLIFMNHPCFSNANTGAIIVTAGVFLVCWPGRLQTFEN
jgi:hypothetical protein